ncbi:methyltransferase domain-containing protein [Aquisalimonas sp.]|uniref:class I SAM-dependent methyltransferase n=1 Tax=Aquisalimonas sp. TaxID=1872621 RepID=UPI0025C486FF|nr:methyltransferase domain-containing protein [Aquisalimonas sp.]
MDTATRLTPAEIYDQLFVPTLFGRFPHLVLDAAGVGRDQAVLDVGCGTGAAAEAALERTGRGGRVAGVDPNEEMLGVARNKGVPIEWYAGSAEGLPLPDGTFDAVISQFALMFFDDPPHALREMVRVLRPGGRLAVSIPDAIDHSPGFSVLAELLHRRFGPDVAEGFRQPFRGGDPDWLRQVCDEAGLTEARIERRDESARFASASEFVQAEGACLWTLGGVLDDAQLQRLAADAEESLAPFRAADGTVTVVLPCLVVTARKA